jgi:hypothetical protein
VRRFFPGSVLLRCAVGSVLLVLVGALALTLAGVGSPADDGSRGEEGVDLSAASRPSRAGKALADARAALRPAVVGGPAATESGPVGETPAASASLALTRLALRYPELSRDEKRQADALLARPTDGVADAYADGYAASARNRRRCTEHVCVHYVTTTRDAPPMGDRDGDRTPTWVERILPWTERVWAFETETLGFREPVPDGSRGGDERFDVYLAQLGDQGVYGYCPAEQPVPGEGYVFSGYCVLDNDFAEFSTAPMRAFRVTLAHELFHAVQYAYDAAEDGWLMESSATWMEEQFADPVDDNRQYLRFGQLGDPSVPLDQFPAGTAPYGNWVFFQALSRVYGADVVRAVWEWADARAGAADLYSTRAVNRVLRERGSSLEEFYATFAAGNLAPTTVYEEAEAGGYPVAPVAETTALGIRAAPYARDLKLDHLTSTTVALRPRASVPRRSWLRLDLNVPRRGAAVVTVERLDGLRVSRRPKSTEGTSSTVRTRFAAATVKRVLVTLTNSSLRFTCWQDSSFSCQGVSQDDMMDTYQVRATLLPPS